LFVLDHIKDENTHWKHAHTHVTIINTETHKKWNSHNTIQRGMSSGAQTNQTYSVYNSTSHTADCSVATFSGIRHYWKAVWVCQ